MKRGILTPDVAAMGTMFILMYIIIIAGIFIFQDLEKDIFKREVRYR